MKTYIHIHEWEADRRHAEVLRACEKRQKWHLEGVIVTRPHGLLYRLTHRKPTEKTATAKQPTLKRAS